MAQGQGGRPGGVVIPPDGGAGRPVIVKPTLGAPMMAQNREFPFILVTQTNPIVVGANLTLSDSFIMDGENAFIFETIRSTHSGAYRLLLSYGSQSGSLMNQPVHVDNLCGTAQRPGFFSQKAWTLPIGARTIITAQFTNLTAVTNTIELVLAGYRKFIDPTLQRTQFTGE